jgi:hypothetical protein
MQCAFLDVTEADIEYIDQALILPIRRRLEHEVTMD